MPEPGTPPTKLHVIDAEETTNANETPTKPVPVDHPDLPEPKVSSEKRKPVLAGWLTNKRDFTATTRHAGANLGYSALYHGVRTPVYAARLTSMAPRGALRFVAASGRWVWDREA